MAAILAEVPALPLHSAGKYVAGAYIVLFVILLIYVAIMASRLQRIEGELGELLDLVPAPEPAPVPAMHEFDLDGDTDSPPASDSPASTQTEARAPR